MAIIGFGGNVLSFFVFLFFFFLNCIKREKLVSDEGHVQENGRLKREKKKEQELF